MIITTTIYAPSKRYQVCSSSVQCSYACRKAEKQIVKCEHLPQRLRLDGLGKANGLVHIVEDGVVLTHKGYVDR